ncbi:MAG: hypothetical protein Q4E53_09655 [Eubacteriales bacterium]|nr:hypothetical protein [Eubacteriales bacterium]
MESNGSINTPLAPLGQETKNGEKIIQCAKCKYRFLKAPRCPECGQLVLYKEKWNKPKLNSYEEWQQTCSIIGANPKDVVNFLKTMLEKEHFDYHVGSTDMSLDYKIPGRSTKLQLFMFFGGNSRCGAFQPSSYYNYAKNHGIGETVINEFLENMKPYLSAKQKNKPYKRIEGYYFVDYSTLVEKAIEIEGLFEWLDQKLIR